MKIFPKFFFQVLDIVLTNNEEFRRNDDLTELRQVVTNVNREMVNASTGLQQQPQKKGYLKPTYLPSNGYY